MSELRWRRLTGVLGLAVAMAVIWAHFSLYAAVAMCCAFLLGHSYGLYEGEQHRH